MPPRARSSGDRALASGARGRRFDSCRAHRCRRGGRGSVMSTMDDNAVTLPYNPAWASSFEEEAAILECLLAPWLDGGIHHVVTSIPALLLYEPALRHRRHHRGLGEVKGNLARCSSAASSRTSGTAIMIVPIMRRRFEEPVDRLRDGADLRMHVHPRRHRRDARTSPPCSNRLQVPPRRRSPTPLRRSRTGRSCWGLAGSSAGETG